MTNEKAIMCLEDMKIKVPIPKAAKQARENNEALDVAIKALKAEPHWIPVTERLPQVQGCYLVTEQIAGVSTVDIRYYNIDDDGQYWSGWYWSRWKDYIVLAWMPLPEPYKGVTT